MRPTWISTIGVVALVLAPSVTLNAQEPGGSAYTVGLGLQQTAQRIEAASPYRYGGVGPEVTVAYDRRTETTDWGVLFMGSRATLRSAITQNESPTERLGMLQLDARYARHVGNALHGRWMLGGELSARVRSTEQRRLGYYSDYFEFVTIGLGPVVHGFWSVGRSTISNAVTLPVVSAGNFPWSNTSSRGSDVSLRFASLANVRSVDNVLRFRGTPESRVTWAYRLSYFSHVGGQARFMAQQSLSMSVALRRRGVMP